MTEGTDGGPHKGTLDCWMTELPQKLRNFPIIHLAIPGSHDSATFGITSKSQLAPDAEPLLQHLRFLGPLLRLVMSRWSKTQHFDMGAQLRAGIRYFDLRFAVKGAEFYFVHGLYAEMIDASLETLRGFLETHPKEAVILDCQHFYAFQTAADHHRLMSKLTSLFHSILAPYNPRMGHLTLDNMAKMDQRLIVIYRSDAARYNQPLLWPGACFPNPWPETVSVSTLIRTLDVGIKSRNFTLGFVSQCVLTPTTWFVCKHLFSTLRSSCVEPLEKKKRDWLRRQKPGFGGVNIVISDFIDDKDYQFPREVIALNYKLLMPAKTQLLTPITQNN